jgi:hypothetical protein
MLIRLVDNATAILTGEEANKLISDFDEWNRDINVLGDRYAMMFEAVQA